MNTVLKNEKDFEDIADGRHMQSLTNVSSGTLATCCRQSGIFGGSILTNSYSFLESLRKSWQLFTYSTNPGSYNNWMESWNAFVLYASNISESFKKDFESRTDIHHCDRVENDKLGEGYDLYFSPLGALRVYDKGLISLGDMDIEHCVTAYLSGADVFGRNTEKYISL